MRNKEAIEILRDTPVDIRSAREDDIHTLYTEAQLKAFDALKKRIPKKPRTVDEEYSYYQCDSCGMCITAMEGDFKSHKYCFNCGQAIDWSEEE